MRWGVLGATGLLGRAILEQLHGQEVAVYVRNPAKLPQDQQLKITQGMLDDRQALKTWADQQDVVLCALGHTNYLPLLRSNLGLGQYPQKTLLQDTIQILLESRLPRLIYCSAYGTGETRQDLPWFFAHVIMPLLLRPVFLDHERVEDQLKAHQGKLAWVVAKPMMLIQGSLTKDYGTFNRASAEHTGAISRADVAHFMIEAATDNHHLSRAVGLSSRKNKATT